MVAVSWLRVAKYGLFAAALSTPFWTYLYGKHVGFEDHERIAEAASAQAEIQYLRRVGELNADIAEINERHAEELAKAKAKKSEVTTKFRELTDANPASPDTDCRIDPDAYELLLDAFRATGGGSRAAAEDVAGEVP